MGDFENLIEWSGAVIAVRKSSPEASHVGAMLRIAIKFLGRWLDITYEIVEYQPGRHITLKSIFGAAPCVFCYRFESAVGGGTKVSEEAVFHLTGKFLGLAEQVATSLVPHQLENDLLMLKYLLESRASIGSIPIVETSETG